MILRSMPAPAVHRFVSPVGTPRRTALSFGAFRTGRSLFFAAYAALAVSPFTCGLTPRGGAVHTSELSTRRGRGNIQSTGGGDCYDVRMTKRRVTLSLDQDVAEALEAVSGRSMSAVANDALRDALAAEAHRVALREWLDELDEKYGAPSAEQFAAADALLEVVQRGDAGATSAA